MSRSVPVWRNREYMILWSGQVLSVMGSGISQISLPLLVLSVTHSAAQAGLVTAFSGLPYPLFGLIAGALVDRWDRKRLMIWCEAANAVITSTIPLALWTGHLSIIQLYSVSFVAGTAFVFFNVAEFAALPSVVTPDQLPAAAAQNQATFGVAGLLGSPIGGILYQSARALPFLADTVSYLVSLASLLLIRVQFQAERKAAPQRVRTEIREGLAWLWRHPVLGPFTGLAAGLNFLGGGFALLVILLAREHGASPAVIGLVFAGAFIGGILGAILAPWMQRRLTFGQVTIGTFTSGIVIFPLYAVSPNVLAIALLTAVVFAIGPIFNVVSQTYRFRVIPDELLGRVNGTGRVIAWGTVPIGAALTGLSLQRFGTSTTICFITAGYVILAALAIASKPIRSAGPEAGN